MFGKSSEILTSWLLMVFLFLRLWIKAVKSVPEILQEPPAPMLLEIVSAPFWPTGRVSLPHSSGLFSCKADQPLRASVVGKNLRTLGG
jgi:hypothetical protein